MNFLNHVSLSRLAPSEHHLHESSAENQLGTQLDHAILHLFPETLWSPLLFDPHSPTFMASADHNAPYSPSPGAEYRDADVDISHIQSGESPPRSHLLAPDQPLQEQTNHLETKASARDDSFKAQPENVPCEVQRDQQPATNTSSSANENEQPTAQIPAQPAIHKSQKRLKRGPYMCKLCRGYGHTAKTCTKRKNPVVHRALNGYARMDQYFSTLLALDEVSRKTPKEQLYLHYEAIMTAVYQLSLSAFRRNPYRREKALLALHKCLEAEKLIANCIMIYNQASSRLGTVISGKENMASYTGPIRQHPEFQAVLQESRRCLYRATSAMKNADCSIRNILSSSLPYGASKRPEPLVGLNSNDFGAKQHVRHANAQEKAVTNQGQEESANTNSRKALSYMFQQVDKCDVLNLEDEGCIPTASMDFRGNTQQQIDASFRDIDLFMPEEKE